MPSQLLMLRKTISNLPLRPEGITAFVAAAPEVGTLPPPERVWLVLALVHYQQRQGWAYQTSQGRVSGALRQKQGEQRSREMIRRSRDEGPVPGLPGWVYRLCEDHTSWRNEGTGEQSEVRALDGPGLVSVFGLDARLARHRRPGPAEQRPRQLLGGEVNALAFALEVLTRHGLLEPAGAADIVRRSRLPLASTFMKGATIR